MEYDYKLPVSGKALKWRPLKVEEVLSEKAAVKSMDANTVAARLYMRRVFWYDGKEGMPSDWRDWDDLDLRMFADHVDEKEGEREAAFRKAQVKDSDALADLQRQLDDLSVLLRQLSHTATAAIEQARVLERARDPLGSGQT